MVRTVSFTSDPQTMDPGRMQTTDHSNANSGRDLAILARKAEDISVWMIERVASFPRAHRHTLGERLVETCLGICTLLVEAHYLPRGSRHRVGLLRRCNRGLTRARILVRMSQRVQAFSHKQRLFACEQLDELGRRTAGWLEVALPQSSIETGG